VALVLAGLDVIGGSSGSGAEQGSGVAAREARTVEPFERVELAGSNNVAIRVGGKKAVLVQGDDNLLDRVTTNVEAGTLVIGNRPGSFETNSPMSVGVSVPSLTGVTLTGSGNVVVGGIDAHSFTVNVSGSGVVAGRGTANRLDVTLSGSGDAQLERLVAADVSAVVSGSGRIVVTATTSLDASVPGSGVIVYGGDPSALTTSVTGSGAVTPG
jgi:hypothetical protein